MGDACPGGICVSPPLMSPAPLKCMTQCRFDYVNRNRDAIASGSMPFPDGSNFCIDTSAKFCRDESNSRNIDASTLSSDTCPEGRKCCYTGVTKPKPTGGRGVRRTGSSAIVTYRGRTFYREACKSGEPSQTFDGMCWHMNSSNECSTIAWIQSYFTGRNAEETAAMTGQTPEQAAQARTQAAAAEMNSHRERCLNARISIPVEGMGFGPRADLIVTLERLFNGNTEMTAITSAGGGSPCGTTAEHNRQGYVCVPDSLTTSCAPGTTLPKNTDSTNDAGSSWPSSGHCVEGMTCCRPTSGSDARMGAACNSNPAGTCTDRCYGTPITSPAIPCDQSGATPFVCCQAADTCGENAVCIASATCKGTPITGVCSTGKVCCKDQPVLEGGLCFKGSVAGNCKKTCGGNTLSPTTTPCETGTVCCQTAINCGPGSEGIAVYTLSPYSEFRSSETGTLTTPCPPGKYCIPLFTTSTGSCVADDLSNPVWANSWCQYLNDAGCHRADLNYCDNKIPPICLKQTEFQQPDPIMGITYYGRAVAKTKYHNPGEAGFYEFVWDCKAQGAVMPSISATGQSTVNCIKRSGTLADLSQELWNDICPRMSLSTYCGLGRVERSNVCSYCPSFASCQSGAPACEAALQAAETQRRIEGNRGTCHDGHLRFKTDDPYGTCVTGMPSEVDCRTTPSNDYCY
ncbi:hypothetical protein HZB90_01850 [archaeon]|nr:hypothetical protein [archaeon]